MREPARGVVRLPNTETYFMLHEASVEEVPGQMERAGLGTSDRTA